MYIELSTFIFPKNNRMKKKLLKLDANSSKKFTNIYNSVQTKIAQNGLFYLLSL